jgi:hypothetical protein
MAIRRKWWHHQCLKDAKQDGRRWLQIANARGYRDVLLVQEARPAVGLVSLTVYE